jgi:hypothetical protein
VPGLVVRRLGAYIDENDHTHKNFDYGLSGDRSIMPPMKRILIAVFSAGWLLPLWVSASVMFQFLSAEVLPRLAGQQPVNSFSFVQFSAQAFTAACVWLGAVIIFWAWRASAASFSPPEQHDRNA